MKRAMVLGVGVIVCSFMSCKKEYMCVCRYNSVESITHYNETKKKAQSACDGRGYQYRNNGANVTCQLE